MNCEKCQDLISDFLDGALNAQDQSLLGTHLEECLSCADVRDDLNSIVGFCRTHRGEYDGPPNEQALWLRIRNMIDAGAGSEAAALPGKLSRSSRWKNWAGRSWELSSAQLVAAAAIIVLVVALSTIVGVRRYQSGEATQAKATSRDAGLSIAAESVRNRFSHQQQMISFWNQRVEFNKARWSPELRETFDRNLQVIDQTVNESINSLNQDPHDAVSEEMLNSALNDKLALLKDFAEL